MTSLRRVAVLAGLSAMILSVTARAETPAVSAAEQAQFQQKTVEAQMNELQERMYHLADLTRDSEPDDSSRLLMAVRKAREDLIMEQMRDCIDQLAHADLGKAQDEQQQILTKLNELKKLLTTTDLDLQMQLEKLKKLNEAIAKLDAGIKEERREQAQTAEMAKANQSKPEDAAKPKADQQQNRKATDAIAQTMKDLGGEPAKAAEKLGNASQNMSLAEGHLGAGHCSDASPLQGRAADQMAEARKQLDAERQKLLDELDKQVRQQVVANLQEMLDRQKSIDGATAAAVAHLNLSDADTRLRIKQLNPAEQGVIRIADETLELIDQTQFSVALPPALQEIKLNCQSVADRLDTGSADPTTVEDEKQIEQDLTDLLSTFKQLAGQPAGPGNCRGCKGNKNKLLAELKTLRVLQARVNAQTQKTDAQRVADAAKANAPQTQQKVLGVRDDQDLVRQATVKLNAELQ